MTGGGDSEYFEQLDEYFINSLSSNPTLLFIPLAGAKENWNDGLIRIQDTFSTIKFENIEMCLDLSELDWDYLSSFDSIYIDGGNTFQLMDKIRNTHFYELLFRFLHHGGVINGDSAGAIILGSHLETAHFGDSGDENESDLISYQGLNLLGNWAIHCHYTSEEDQEILDFENDFGFPVIALHEQSGISINGKVLEVFGRSKVVIFKDGKKNSILPGNKINLLKDV